MKVYLTIVRLMMKSARKAVDEMLSKLSEELQADNVNKLAVFLWEFRHIRSVNNFDIGYTDVVSHHT
jgi:hypothetical protein